VPDPPGEREGGDADGARRPGAEEVYDTAAVDVTGAVRAAHPDSVDGVPDLVSGPDAVGRDADIIKPGETLASTIFAADGTAVIRVQRQCAHALAPRASCETSRRWSGPCRVRRCPGGRPERTGAGAILWEDGPLAGQPGGTCHD
jgi:hypothetical protein